MLEALKSEENRPSDLRTIRFRKVDGKFGASHMGTSISEVDQNGPAGLAGLKRGDQLISINGINVEFLSEKEIAKLAVDCDDDVTLVVRLNLERMVEIENLGKAALSRYASKKSHTSYVYIDKNNLINY